MMPYSTRRHNERGTRVPWTGIALIATLLLTARTASADTLPGKVRQIGSILQQGNYDRALETARELETEYPDDPLPAYCAGMACYQKARQQESADAKDEAIGSYADAAQFFSQAAGREKSDQRLANECLLAAATAQVRRGNLLGSMEKYEEAAGVMRAALKQYERLDGDPRAEKGRLYAAVKLREWLSKAREKQRQQDQKENQSSPEQAGLIMEAVTELPRKQVVVDNNAAVLRDQPETDGGAP
ncbi:MAG TPA: hypothetical protein PK379_06405 [Candidatus Hydrogenedentes bacterium]|nr:hypothetical protein [Candidatus Hydrogenedentota bacterium]